MHSQHPRFAPGDKVSYRVSRWNGRAYELVEREATVVRMRRDGRVTVITDHDGGKKMTVATAMLTPLEATDG